MPISPPESNPVVDEGNDDDDDDGVENISISTSSNICRSKAFKHF